MSGSGKLTEPWDLATAFASEVVSNSVAPQPRNLWLLDGTSSDSNLALSLSGESGRRITIRPYSNASPKLNGALTLSGSYWTLKNVEIYWDGWTTRESSESGSDPGDLVRKNLGGYGTGLKLINCIIHDLGQPYFSEAFINLEIYGSVISMIGWNGPDRGHGHPLYLRNTSALMKIKDCILCDSFGWGLHAYSPVASDLKNFYFEGNTSLKAGSLSGTARPNYLLGSDPDAGQADTSSWIANMSYGGSVGLSFYSDGATHVTLTDNYMPDGKSGTYSADSESGNYWGPAIGNQVFLRANDYDTELANLTIFNQDQAATIQKDVTELFDIGDTIFAHNAQDYLNDIQELTVAGDGTITVNMQAANRSVATPVQWSPPATVFPDFGCFRLVRA